MYGEAEPQWLVVGKIRWTLLALQHISDVNKTFIEHPANLAGSPGRVAGA